MARGTLPLFSNAVGGSVLTSATFPAKWVNTQSALTIFPAQVSLYFF